MASPVTALDIDALAAAIRLDGLDDPVLEMRHVAEARIRRDIADAIGYAVAGALGLEVKTCLYKPCGRRFRVGGGELAKKLGVSRGWAQISYCRDECKWAAARDRAGS